jgi:endonuclease YncB( thermonuclease family)
MTLRPLTSLISFLLLAAVLLLFVKPVLVGLVSDGTWLAEPRAEAPAIEEAPPPAKPEAPSLATQVPHAPKAATVDEQKRLRLARGETEAERLAALREAGHAVKPERTTKRYFRVTVRDGGTLQTGKLVITLKGIEARAAKAKCQDADGKSWPCGTMARAALARLIHGRAVVCTSPPSTRTTEFAARCRAGGVDLSAWMVRQGWARPAADAEPALSRAYDAAKSAKLGLWRLPPP